MFEFTKLHFNLRSIVVSHYPYHVISFPIPHHHLWCVTDTHDLSLSKTPHVIFCSKTIFLTPQLFFSFSYMWTLFNCQYDNDGFIQLTEQDTDSWSFVRNKMAGLFYSIFLHTRIRFWYLRKKFLFFSDLITSDDFIESMIHWFM